MPTFDGGHYFLTVLLPVKTKPIEDGVAVTSPVHALRKRLAMLPPAKQTPACAVRESPFARNKRNHFARFVVIDDVAYNGRQQPATLWTTIFRPQLTIAQPQDHLFQPFLLFAAEFDAASGADSERNSYLAGLWATMEEDLRAIFACCEGFDAKMTDAASFAHFIAKGQIETTMPFNDYYVDALNLPTWQVRPYVIAAAATVVAAVVIGFLFGGWAGVIFGALALAAVVWFAYRRVAAFGARPLPTAPDSNLPAVLKALYLQRAFTRFAIDNQVLAATPEPAAAQQLHDAFGRFIAIHQPVSLDEPTQAPGVIGA